MTEREQAAEKYVKGFVFLDDEYTLSPKQIKQHVTNDFLAGYDTGKDHADREHRALMLDLREHFMPLLDKSDFAKSDYPIGRILIAIRAFTERELNQLPFKK